MSESLQRPLLTFAIAGFNQERFVKEAVEAAFAQTYSPLQIILSDDCSKDRTFEIMEQMAADYRGPHRLVLNRNPIRRSIGGHINRLAELAEGEMIIGAAGDDVSLPQRTQRVFEAWDQAGRLPTSVHSDIIQIDENGGVIERRYASSGSAGDAPVTQQDVKLWDYMDNFEPLVFGAAHAFSPQLFKPFGNLPDEVLHEDTVLPFRSIILSGRMVYIKEPLVKYRLHGNNIFLTAKRSATNLKSLEREEDHLKQDCKHRRIAYDTFLKDLQSARQLQLISKADYEKAAEKAGRLRGHYSLMGQFLDSGVFDKCRILSRLRREGLNPRDLKILNRRLVPRSILLRLRLARAYVSLAAGNGAKG